MTDPIYGRISFSPELDAAAKASREALPPGVQLGLQSFQSLWQQFCDQKEELAQWKTWGVIEVAIRNPSVAEAMRHWEGRAEKAEGEVARLRAELLSAVGQAQQHLEEVERLTRENADLWRALHRLHGTITDAIVYDEDSELGQDIFSAAAVLDRTLPNSASPSPPTAHNVEGNGNV